MAADIKTKINRHVQEDVWSHSGCPGVSHSGSPSRVGRSDGRDSTLRYRNQCGTHLELGQTWHQDVSGDAFQSFCFFLRPKWLLQLSILYRLAGDRDKNSAGKIQAWYKGTITCLWRYKHINTQLLITLWAHNPMYIHINTCLLKHLTLEITMKFAEDENN